MKHTDRPFHILGPTDVKWPSTRLGARKPDSPNSRHSAQPLAWSLPRESVSAVTWKDHRADVAGTPENSG